MSKKIKLFWKIRGKSSEENKTIQGSSNNEFEKPEAPFNKFQWVGLLLAVVFAAAVFCVSIFGKENFDKYLIVIVFSITAVLFATIFYCIYKYKISCNDSIIEDYLKDKELYRQLKRKKVEMESGYFVKKSELDEIKNSIAEDIVGKKEFKNFVESTLSTGTVENLYNIANHVDELKKTIEKLETTISTKNVDIKLSGVDIEKEIINNLQNAIDKVAKQLE